MDFALFRSKPRFSTWHMVGQDHMPFGPEVGDKTKRSPKTFGPKIAELAFGGLYACPKDVGGFRIDQAGADAGVRGAQHGLPSVAAFLSDPQPCARKMLDSFASE